MNLFGCKFCENHDDNKKCLSDQDKDKDRKNFDSLLWALVTVFQVFKLKSNYN
jgi:voltage-dependent calcium channel T type alpha-1G